MTKKSFSQSALIATMKAAWNSANQVVWRRINANLFSIQFNCLGDWNKAMHQGPWDFKGSTLLLTEYDGFSNPKKVKLDSWKCGVKSTNYLMETLRVHQR